MLILLPAIVLCDPWTVLLFAPREMFFCDESLVSCPQMMVLSSPSATLFIPQAIIEFFHFPSCVVPPKIIAFSPFIILFFPTIIIASFPEFLFPFSQIVFSFPFSQIVFSFPQMRSEFSQLLLLVFASSVFVAENFPSRWMTPC